VRVRVDSETYDLAQVPKLNRRQNHDIAVVVDRLMVRRTDRPRLADSIETALKAADGTVEVVHGAKSTLFSERYACPACGLSLPEFEPRQFSFNSPFGACPDCSGLGTRREVNPDLVLGDPSLSILEGVILPGASPRATSARSSCRAWPVRSSSTSTPRGRSCRRRRRRSS